MLLLISCKKETVYRNGAPGELPAETQTGANTFGCLVNGRVWKPQGKPLDNVLDLSYDPTFNGGTMSIKAKKYSDSANIQIIEYMDLAMSQLSKMGEYSLNTSAQNAVAAYTLFLEQGSMVLKTCSYNQEDAIREGRMKITKLDTQQGILSGTFDCTLALKSRSRCDTTFEILSDNTRRIKYIVCQRDCDSLIRITQGRFDLKM